MGPESYSKPADRLYRPPRTKPWQVVLPAEVRRPRASTITPRVVIYGFVGIIAVGAILLTLPAASQTGQTSQSAMGAADTTAGEHKMTRKEMRRVVVNIYVPETTLSASSGAPQSQQMNTTAPSSSPTQNQVGTDNQTAPSPR